MAQLADLAGQEVDVVRLARSALPHYNAATGHPVRVEAEVPTSATSLSNDSSNSYLHGLLGERRQVHQVLIMKLNRKTPSPAVSTLRIEETGSLKEWQTFRIRPIHTTRLSFQLQI